MATDFLSQLQSDFATVVRAVLVECAAKSIVMRPYSAVRSPWQQAVLWRQSRSIEQITAAATTMRNQGAAWLADTLLAVGPHHGDHVTNALPGRSAHQYRLAVDCYWFRDGEAEWQDMTGYRIYAMVAQANGLSPGLFWTTFVDPPHVQHGSMDDLPGRSWAMIDAQMYALWGNTPTGQWGRP